MGMALVGAAPYQAKANDLAALPVATLSTVHQARGPPAEITRSAPQVADARGPPPRLSADEVQRIGQALPDVLIELSSGARVTHGTDPGDFYCEHAFYTSTAAALQPDSSILKNAVGEVLTGFLHVPSDSWTYDGSRTPDQSERHEERRAIVGSAIRGYFEQARSQLDGTFKLLLTGYGAWGGVVNNPSGDFTAHKENIDAAMRHAFGDQLLSPSGTVLRDDDHGESVVRRLSYNIRDPLTGAPTKIIIEATRLPVTDEAINGGPRSLQTRIADFRPHAVLSMGVAGGGDYKAEFHADDGGLVIRDGVQAHDDSQSPRHTHPDNRSLARALHLGRNAIVAPPNVTVPVVPRV
jgi:pyrrolidone-carboxylate peptidase